VLLAIVTKLALHALDQICGKNTTSSSAAGAVALWILGRALEGRMNRPACDRDAQGTVLMSPALDNDAGAIVLGSHRALQALRSW
jgi:hypothetical protein